MAIMTINAVAKAVSASWMGNYSLIWSGLIAVVFPRGYHRLVVCRASTTGRVIILFSKRQ